MHKKIKVELYNPDDHCVKYEKIGGYTKNGFVYLVTQSTSRKCKILIEIKSTKYIVDFGELRLESKNIFLCNDEIYIEYTHNDGYKSIPCVYYLNRSDEHSEFVLHKNKRHIRVSLGKHKIINSEYVINDESLLTPFTDCYQDHQKRIFPSGIEGFYYEHSMWHNDGYSLFDHKGTLSKNFKNNKTMEYNIYTDRSNNYFVIRRNIDSTPEPDIFTIFGVVDYTLYYVKNAPAFTYQTSKPDFGYEKIQLQNNQIFNISDGYQYYMTTDINNIKKDHFQLDIKEEIEYESEIYDTNNPIFKYDVDNQWIEIEDKKYKYAHSNDNLSVFNELTPKNIKLLILNISSGKVTTSTIKLSKIQQPHQLKSDFKGIKLIYCNNNKSPYICLLFSYDSYNIGYVVVGSFWKNVLIWNNIDNTDIPNYIHPRCIGFFKSKHFNVVYNIKKDRIYDICNYITDIKNGENNIEYIVSLYGNIENIYPIPNDKQNFIVYKKYCQNRYDIEIHDRSKLVIYNIIPLRNLFVYKFFNGITTCCWILSYTPKSNCIINICDDIVSHIDNKGQLLVDSVEKYNSNSKILSSKGTHKNYVLVIKSFEDIKNCDLLEINEKPIPPKNFLENLKKECCSI